MITTHNTNKNQPQFVIGVDFGTDSVRSVIVDASNGEEAGNSVNHYSRWNDGKYCDASKNQFRQHPLDFIESLEESIKDAISELPEGASKYIKGISVDTTGSTPVAVDKNGLPLALTPGFEENPNGMFILWKDHTAVQEAADINNAARSWESIDYTQYVGGVYSSEWFWAKALHVLRTDETVRDAAYSWVEHCDWIPALLTGNTDPLAMKRSRCAAGHKAMWNNSYNGLPPEDFLISIDPLFKGLRERLFKKTYTCDVKAGMMSSEWVNRLGLHEHVSVGVGAFDAHLGAVGVEIEPYVLCKVMGTSTCDMLVVPNEEIGETIVKGICGQVDGSIIPGMIGMEAGQSGFGDIYAWFKDIIMNPVENFFADNTRLEPAVKEHILSDFSKNLIPNLSREAQNVPVDESGIIALDWMNGRRTPDANQALEGVLTGLNLSSDTPKIFRALVEATGYGARKIVERFNSEGVKIDGVIGLGGIPKKSPFIMQTITDILNKPIKIARSEQACALGSAMAAAAVSGIYSTLEEAQKAMGKGFEKEYYPDPVRAKKYNELYKKYLYLGDFVENHFS